MFAMYRCGLPYPRGHLILIRVSRNPRKEIRRTHHSLGLVTSPLMGICVAPYGREIWRVATNDPFNDSYERSTIDQGDCGTTRCPNSVPKAKHPLEQAGKLLQTLQRSILFGEFQDLGQSLLRQIVIARQNRTRRGDSSRFLASRRAVPSPTKSLIVPCESYCGSPLRVEKDYPQSEARMDTC